MESTGIVRRVDDLGRVVIPKEVRRVMQIDDGGPVEIFIDADQIVLKKYEPGCVICGSAVQNDVEGGRRMKKLSEYDLRTLAGLCNLHEGIYKTHNGFCGIGTNGVQLTDDCFKANFGEGEYNEAKKHWEHTEFGAVFFCIIQEEL